ncbi:hypothetical protein ABT093_33185 [Kitasatospora sp. NPDC002551]|uniref:hypothetical protein n=1 Tax=Kitasatospora sp. NPDC002551 TaxID=3154539 RepID=UPI003318AA13
MLVSATAAVITLSGTTASWSATAASIHSRMITVGLIPRACARRRTSSITGFGNLSEVVIITDSAGSGSAGSAAMISSSVSSCVS